MMLIKLISDLHLEASNFRYVDHGEHVCVLAGDAGEGMRGVNWALANIPSHIQVFYVPGNHEYYGNNYPLLNKMFRDHNKKCTHVRVLMQEVITKDSWDVEFVGTTLWTDFNLYGNAPLHERAWAQGLNDSVWMRNGDRRVNADDFKKWNKASLRFLKKVAATPTEKTRILITHYCFEMSVSARYRGDPLTPGFATKIPVDIHEKFAYHMHGHTHDSMNYQMPYGTKVICNPRGYGMENVGAFNGELVLDI